MKNHKNRPRTMKNQPGWLQETPRRKWWFFITHIHFIIIYISSSLSYDEICAHLTKACWMYSRVVHTFSIEGRHIFGMCLTLKTQKSFLQMGSEHGLTFSSMCHSQNSSDLSTLNIAWSIYQFVVLKVCSACCFLFKNIAKGTTYLRVEFCLPKFKQVQTQILIKFHLQDQTKH